ncbi:hypothetical protein PYW07_007002 [Mythimna separata]|uniref:Uncharacterized protein n=1 Tax=Mythimna separata TaxID=271217 RepID=A0AAD7Z383_MYTSE|nr:hypothetical protein PYW07_007002 [Mythimna separata]
MIANNRVPHVREPQEIYKANSGSITFKMRTQGNYPELVLIAHHEPHVCLYKLTLGYETKVYRVDDKQEENFPSRVVSNFHDFREFYLTWHNGKIKLGIIGQEPFVDYQKKVTDPIIGYILFKTQCRSSQYVEWIVETSPVLLKSIPFKRMKERLHWRNMRNGRLPPDAMIGGFEDEFIYIARAEHYSSLCPGKYVPSTRKAFIPWGHIVNAKEDFEILCGINAQWVKTRSNYVPQNAFIGGYTEVGNEPLYIGRAMVDGKLICGKVHLLYKMCYLPYKGREVVKKTYEILVIPGDKIPQALPLRAF